MISEDTEYKTFIESQMRHRMDVFTTVGSTSGRYDVPAGTNEECLLARVSSRNAPTIADRTQLSQLRQLTFRVDFVMPKRARVLIGGKLWQVVTDSIDTVDGPANAVIAQVCDLVSADRSST